MFSCRRGKHHYAPHHPKDADGVEMLTQRDGCLCKLCLGQLLEWLFHSFLKTQNYHQISKSIVTGVSVEIFLVTIIFFKFGLDFCVNLWWFSHKWYTCILF